MAALLPSQIDDLITGTLRGFDYNKWVQLAQRQQDYPLWRAIVNRKRMTQEGGDNIQWYVWLDQLASARNVGLFAQDQVDVNNVMQTATASWIKTTYATAWDIDEKNFNAGKRQIFDHIKVRFEDSSLGAMEHFENQMWGGPTSAAEDAMDGKARGLDYWLHIDTGTSTTGGFNGPHAIGSTTGGLNHANWKHWVEAYAAVTKTDLITGMREAAVKCNFESPMGLTEFKEAGGTPRRMIYAPYSVIASMETLAENQNDKLGRDMASMDGQVLFRGSPVMWGGKKLDDKTSPGGRVYMIDWNTFEFKVLAGTNFRKTGPTAAPNQHTVRVVHTDIIWQLICKNRRQNAVFATAA